MLQEEDNVKPSPSFPKSERLCSKKAIDLLIEQNTTVFVYPLKCYYAFLPVISDSENSQVLFSVPKRFFKKAVDRNKIKRRLKEAYRLNKGELIYQKPFSKEYKLNLLIVYLGKEILPFQSIEKSMNTILNKIVFA